MTTDPTLVQQLDVRLAEVRERIATAAVAVGRDPASVTLIAVSKTHPWATIAAAAEAGQRDFGENRLEEALAKRIEPGAADLAWHMIGHVQSRKAAAVVEAGFDLIHSVDTIKLAERLSRAAQPLGRTQSVLLECNVSGEDSKSGFAAANDADWPALIDTWSTLGRLPGLSVVGLMTMAPWGTDDETARPIFARLRELSAVAQARLGLVWPVLSMGMTDDYAGAVREGATHVRVGRAIFGDRG